MKLRLRSLQTKETTKLQVADACTVQELREALSLAHPSSSSSSSSLFTFSLNGKDDLLVSSPQDTLQSLGVTSGDLIYFSSSDPRSASSSGNPQRPVSGDVVVSTVSECSGQKDASLGDTDGTLVGGNSVNLVGSLGVHVEEAGNVGPDVGDMGCLGQKDANLAETDGTLVEGSSGGSEDMFVEETENVGPDVVDAEGDIVDPGGLEGLGVDGKKAWEPYFLRRVLQEEVGGDRCVKKLLVVAVHAVFLESGFVGYDSFSRMRVDGFHIVDEWPDRAFTMSLFYTLPELLENEGMPEFVKLRFQSLGDFVNIYGSLGTGGLRMCRVCLNGKRFGPVMDLVWANGDDVGAESLRSEQEVFEFWKVVKDGLAYPLLIDLCEKCGLGLPPCLMRLPMDLKLKILESLPGVDVAKMGCVCVEMRYLSSNNDLWKQKMVEEFGGIDVGSGMVNWKQRFALSWEGRKRRRSIEDSRDSRRLRSRYRIPERHPFPVPRFPIIWRDPDPLGAPSFIGGDYDRLPGLGIPAPGRQPPLGFPRFQHRSNFSPNCHLGGSNN